MAAKQGLVITIDGPSGTGKSTAARELAGRLGYLYLDTGAMYRVVALRAVREKISLADHKSLALLAQKSKIRFRVDPGHRLRLLLNGEDVTEAIRRHEVSEVASAAAAIPGVRKALVAKQRQIGRMGRVVAEGRDTGTIVFPAADLKFFLTADEKERAKRRFKELLAAGQKVAQKEVLAGMRVRDKRDQERAASPLRKAKGAVVIDNTRLQSSQVVGRMLVYVQRIRKK